MASPAPALAWWLLPPVVLGRAGLSLLVSAGLVAAGWRLAHHSTRELLRAGQRD